uniref:Putative secreted peptide n=1 Tax=Anopheles braziliensis TaxID=58242 RepID=A0A2M3ZVA1_9DIPT
MLLLATVSTASSASCFNLTFEARQSSMSFMYTLYSRGLKQDPWGSPKKLDRFICMCPLSKFIAFSRRRLERKLFILGERPADLSF